MKTNQTYYYGQNTIDTKVVTFVYAGFMMEGLMAFYIHSEICPLEALVYYSRTWANKNLRDNE